MGSGVQPLLARTSRRYFVVSPGPAQAMWTAPGLTRSAANAPAWAVARVLTTRESISQVTAPVCGSVDARR
jgi:hypothetical protein